MTALVQEYWALAMLASMALGSLLTIGFRAFAQQYFTARASSLAADVDLPRQLQRTFADQETKALALRLDATKAEGAMKILGLMAEIETTLFNWKLNAYFHLDDLKAGETVEDLALRDLKRVSALMVSLMREASANVVLLGDDLLADVTSWVSNVQETIFDFHAAYQTSKRMNEGKSASDNDRVKTVTSLMQLEVYPRMNSLGESKKQIRQRLSANVQRSVAALVR